MKIIFLDIDGVLNSQLWYLRIRNGETSCHDDVGLHNRNIDTTAVKFLNTLIDETGAKVVITSTWRLGRTIGELQSILESAGFVGEVIGKTEDLRYGSGGESILRGNEILHWIKSNEALLDCYYNDFKSYVIIDDDSDMLYWQRNNFVQTDGYVGMTPTTIFKSKKILNT